MFLKFGSEIEKRTESMIIYAFKEHSRSKLKIRKSGSTQTAPAVKIFGFQRKSGNQKRHSGLELRRPNLGSNLNPGHICIDSYDFFINIF